MSYLIDVDPYEDPVSNVTRFRLTDVQTGTKMQTSLKALLELAARITDDGEFDKWLGGPNGELESGDD